uniref:Odorant receptor n=1 Tax=Adelphocoris lineolatus TaxID=236346 RepID=A0A2I4PHA0_ADELI|nr:olfactory receptor 65 [Adelphocoris lineolatus]
MKNLKKGTSSWRDLKGLAREEALRRGYAENGGTYVKMGAQYVATRNDIWMPVVFFSDLMLAVFQLTAAGYFSVIDGDMEAASECFHFITMISNMMIITANLIYYKNIFDDLFVATGSGFFDYGDSLDPQTKNEMEAYISNMKVKKRFRFRTFVLVVWTLGGSMLFKVALAYFRFGDRIDGEGGSVSRKHIVAQWFFGIDKWPNYIFMASVTYIAEVLVMTSVWGFVLPVICFAEESTAQLNVIGLGLKRTSARARYVFTCRFGEYKSVHKLKYEQCVREVLRASVQHHNAVLDVCNEMRTLLNLPLMTVMFNTAVLLCMSGFVMIEDSVPIIAKIISLLFMIGEVIYSYIFCLYGEMMTSTSEEIGNQLYQDNWKEVSVVIKPYLAMIKMRSSKPIRLSAGGFMEVNEAAFSGIISSSYSYFNLMLTSKS